MRADTMPCKLALLVSRVLLPCVFSLGVVAGCTSEIPNSPLLRGNGQGPATDAPKAEAEGETGTPATPTGPQSPTGGTSSQDGAPTLSAIAPDAVTIGTTPQGIDLTLTGTRFIAGAQVVLGGVTLGATFKSATELLVHVPGAQTSASGVYRIVVSAKAGALSNPMTFTVANPASVAIDKLVPDVATIGDAGPMTIAITGSGFAPTSQVRFNGTLLTTKFTSATELSATMTMSTLLDAGRYGVTVSTGSDVVSLPRSFDVRNPTPLPSTITPSSVTEGAAAITVTIDGTGFTKASEVLAAGAPLVTTFISGQRLRATIPATQLATARSIPLVVRSPSPGGGTATAKTFTVAAAAAGSSSGGAGGGAGCVYRCVDYGYAPGECFEDWYCIASGTYAGCLGETACN